MATQSKPDAQAASDVMPEIEDDIDDAVIAGQPEVEAGDDDDDTQPVVRAEKPEDPREAAVRKYREMRDAQAAADAGDAGDDADGDEKEDAAPIVAAKTAPVAAPAAAPEPTYTLIVDGKPVTMTASEVVAKAQITVAADNRLDEAKRLVQEARALRGPVDPPANQRSDDDDLNAQDDQASRDQVRTNQSKPVIDAAKLKDIVQRLQVGDEDEGQAALSDLIEIIGAGHKNEGVNRDQLAPLVKEHIDRTNLQSEFKIASDAFQTGNAAIIQDPELLATSFQRLRGEVLQDLEQAGLESSKLAPLNGAQLLELHQSMRMRGAKVRDYNTVFQKVSTDMTAKYGALIAPKTVAPTQTRSQPIQPAPSDRIAERIERKRSATPQPRTAGVRVASQPSQVTKSKADIIAEMRKQRGYVN